METLRKINAYSLFLHGFLEVYDRVMFGVTVNLSQNVLFSSY